MRRTMRILASVAMFGFAGTADALDSYRYLHVTIDTPWYIFLFLLPIVLSPFILMAILYWRFAGRKPEDSNRDKTESSEGQ